MVTSGQLAVDTHIYIYCIYKYNILSLYIINSDNIKVFIHDQFKASCARNKKLAQRRRSQYHVQLWSGADGFQMVTAKHKSSSGTAPCE